MAESRYYPKCGPYLAALSRYLIDTFEQKGFDVQLVDDMDSTSPGRTFQMRPRYSESWVKTLSTFTGLDTAATVIMKVDGNDLEVSFGGAKWLDKAAVAGVGMLASLGVLLVPAGIGAWKQHQLLQRLEQTVDDFFREQP